MIAERLEFPLTLALALASVVNVPLVKDSGALNVPLGVGLELMMGDVAVILSPAPVLELGGRIVLSPLLIGTLIVMELTPPFALTPPLALATIGTLISPPAAEEVPVMLGLPLPPILESRSGEVLMLCPPLTSILAP